MVEILCCEYCKIVIGDYESSYTFNNAIYCHSCFADDSDDDYSSSDEYYDKCYYCNCELTFDMEVYEDLEPCKPRYYCISCYNHIHDDEIYGEEDF